MKTIQEFTGASSVHGLAVSRVVKFSILPYQKIGAVKVLLPEKPKLGENKKMINLSPQYIAEAGASLMASRVFWLIMVVTAASLGISWSSDVSYLEEVTIDIS